MGTDDWVIGIGVARLVGDAVIGILPAIVLAVMPRRQTVEIGLHAVAERLIGGIHIGEQGVATFGRALADIKDRAHRRLDDRMTRRSASLRHWRAGCPCRHG